jgi:hypothetical protein
MDLLRPYIMEIEKRIKESKAQLRTLSDELEPKPQLTRLGAKRSTH